MSFVKKIKHVFEKSYCNICLNEDGVKKYDKLDICQECLKKIKDLESEKPFDISKENIAGGIKDEL